MKGTKLILFLLVLLTPYFPTYGLSYSDPDITNCTSSAGVLKETYCTMISSNGIDSCYGIATQYCNQVPGCVLRSGVCQACPAGTADKTSDKTSSLDIQFKQQNETCKSCSFSSYSNYKFEIPGWVLPNLPNQDSYPCPYTVVCNDGKYYDFTDSTCKSCAPNQIMPTGQGSTYIPNTTVGTTKDAGCYTCGEKSSPNDTQTECKCNTYYQYNGSPSVTDCPNGICPPCTYKPTNITYKCTGDTKTTYDDFATSEDYHINVNFSNNCTKIGYTLAGWQCTSCENTQTIYKTGSSFYNPAANVDEYGTIKFTSHFEPKTFTITFKSSTSSDATNCFDPSSFNCTYNDKCTNTNSQNIQAYLYKQGYCEAPADTPIFDGWECYKTNATGATVPCSENTDTNHITYDEIAGIIDVNTGMVKEGKDDDFKNIINLSGGDNAIFVPKFTKCPNGKYCSSSGDKSDCPAPSTSNYDDNNYEPKNSIRDCFITKDTTFCPNNESDTTKCFKLETLGATEDTKIHHVEQDNGIVYE